MRRVRSFLVLLALLAWVAVPVSASAQDNAGLGQYQENVPGAGGDAPDQQGGGGQNPAGGGGANGGGSGGSNGSGGGSQSGDVPQGTVDELQSLGDDGAAAAQAAIETSPAGTPTGSAANGGGGSGNGASAGAGSNTGSGSSTSTGDDSGSGDSGGGGIGELLGKTVGGSDSGGMGPALPIILGIVVLGALGVLVARRGGFSGLHRG